MRRPAFRVLLGFLGLLLSGLARAKPPPHPPVLRAQLGHASFSLPGLALRLKALPEKKALLAETLAGTVLFDLEDGRTRGSLSHSAPRAAAYHPDRDWAVVADAQGVHVGALESDESFEDLETYLEEALSDFRVQALAFMPQSPWLLVGGLPLEGGETKDLAQLRCLDLTLRAPAFAPFSLGLEQVQSILVAPGGRRIYLSSRGSRIRVLDLDGGEVPDLVLDGFGGSSRVAPQIWDLAFEGPGSHSPAVLLGLVRGKGLVRFDLATGALLQKISLGSLRPGPAYAPLDQAIPASFSFLAADFESAKFFQVTEKTGVSGPGDFPLEGDWSGLPGPPTAAAFVGEGRLALALPGPRVELYEAKSGRRIQAPEEIDPPLSGWIYHPSAKVLTSIDRSRALSWKVASQAQGASGIGSPLLAPGSIARIFAQAGPQESLVQAAPVGALEWIGASGVEGQLSPEAGGVTGLAYSKIQKVFLACTSKGSLAQFRPDDASSQEWFRPLGEDGPGFSNLLLSGSGESAWILGKNQVLYRYRLADRSLEEIQSFPVVRVRDWVFVEDLEAFAFTLPKSDALTIVPLAPSARTRPGRIAQSFSIDLRRGTHEASESIPARYPHEPRPGAWGLATDGRGVLAASTSFAMVLVDPLARRRIGWIEVQDEIESDEIVWDAKEGWVLFSRASHGVFLDFRASLRRIREEPQPFAPAGG